MGYRMKFLRGLVFLLLVITSASASFIQWDEEKQLTFLDQYHNVFYPRIACSGDTVYIAFEDSWLHHLYFITSTNAGETWSETLRLSPDDSIDSNMKAIEAVGCTVHVAWNDFGFTPYRSVPTYRRSTNGGKDWDSIIVFTPPDYEGKTSEFAVGPGDTIVIPYWMQKYVQDDTGAIRISSDGGSTWGSPIYCPDWMAKWQFFHLRYNSGCLHAVHRGYPLNSWVEILYNRSTDFGSTWSDTIILSSNDSIHSFRPSFTVDGRGNLYAIWCDYKFSPYPWTGDIFLVKSTDNGLTWSDYQMLTDLHRAQDNEIYVVGDTIYVVYQDARDYTPDDTFEIYFRVSTDQGQTWFDEERLTFPDGHFSSSPDLAVSRNWIYVIWSDRRDGNYDVFFKRGWLGVGVGEERNQRISLLKISPSVFSDRISITGEGCGSVVVYDLVGREIIKLWESTGTFSVIWDGRDKHGHRLPEGIYFIVFSGDKPMVRKVIKVKRKQ